METIWLQRSSPDIPWGFRLVGGREFGVPLAVQRVTPGSVAAAGLGPGDVILKVGNVMATNLEHNDAMELVKQAGNILQLTIKKVEGPSPPGPLSPSGSGYGSAVTAQLNDNSYNAPRGFGTGIPLNTTYSSNNAAPSYATTPRNYGSQNQPQQGTRIEIQRVNPPQQKNVYSNNYYNNDDNADSGGPSFPDYTIAYKRQEPEHDTPGGPANIRGFVPPGGESNSFSSKSLPRGVGSYNNSGDRDGFGGGGGPPAYEPRSYNASQSSFSPSDNKFNTGLPYQPSQPQKAQPSYQQPSYNSTSTPQSYNSAPGPFSPTSYSGPLSPRSQTSSSGFVSADRKPSPYGTEQSTPYNQTPSGYGSSSSGFDQSNVHGSGSNTYSTLPHSKPTYNTNNNNSFSIYNSAPQPYSAPKPYAPTQPGTAYNAAPAPFSPSQARPYQSPMSPGSSSNYSSSAQPAIRRVSFDQNVQDNGPYSPSTNFSPRPYKSPPPVSTSYSAPAYSRSASQHDDYGVSDFGAPVPQPASFSRQSSRSQDPYSSSPYGPPGGPMSPRSEQSGFGYGGGRGGYDPSGVSAGMDNLNLGSPRYEPPPPPAAPAPPPPPPPPPPPSGPPPPPAPPLHEWNTTPYRRQNHQPSEEPDEQKVPDQLLNTMLKSAKGGGPKPFSYGIDLSELKKKMGPPTAPKPRKGQPGYQGPDEQIEVPRQYGGPPKKPAGYVQSDYFIPRDDDHESGHRAPKKPAGQVQSDYFLSRDTGPRAEIDESPININMGTNPKKQSKSFKVLQWMTETEKDDPEEPTVKPKRTKDPERRHNADDDEMRFSGLHSKADIPSKAFGRLQKMPVDNAPATQNGKDTLDVGDAEDGVGNYEESSIRYKGKNIPSPSFRVLQSWAEHDPDPNINTSGAKKSEEEDDDLPDTLNSEDMVDKRYKGGNIPSKVFKTLQKSVGDDTPEVPPQPTRQTSVGGGQPMQSGGAPISDF